ncbi:methyltransferase [Nanchangia anserum]|uniref:methyltransferase n=1 Tax=Nanchangia anserum TaxID=2692125 RepID=UPI0018832AD2|nr:methyltransferase [Nanchangia anserum]QOX81752.1 methyltransferase [Nanchangia anserum]
MPGAGVTGRASARRPGRARPRGVLTRLFELGHDVDAAALREALGEDALAAARAVGVVEDAGAGRVRCPGVIARVGKGPDGLWLMGDRDLATSRGALGGDHVSALTHASLTLHRLLGTTARGRVLDLGCGSGVHALWAARHATHVVATDVSERALAITRANARLNGLDVETRSGSLYEPVAGERFDVVCSNAPFVITPPSAGERLVYRDAGFPGDTFVRDLVRGLADHLNEGGRGYVLANWFITDTDAPSAGVEGWLTDQPVDAWILGRDQMDAASYAAHWVRDAGYEGPHAHERARAWARWLEEQGIAAIGMGIIAVRRVGSARRGAIRTDWAHAGQPLPHPEQIERVWTGIAALSDADDASLDAARPRPIVELKESRVLALGTGRADTHTLVPAPADAALGQVVTNAPALAVLGALDGDLTLRQAAVAVATLMDLDAQAVTDAARDLLREVVARGMYVLD